MHTESNEPRAGDGPELQRAIVLQLLRDDRGPRWSQADLRTELDVDAVTLDAALQVLNGEGVLSLAEQEVWACPAARKLDELELIGI